MYNKVLSALLRGIWAIDLEEAYAKADLVANFLNGTYKAEVEKPVAGRLKVINSEVITTQGLSSFAEAAPGSVAIIPVEDELMKFDYCGAPGTATIARWVKEADASENISAILLHIDSPGGTVDGTQTLSNAIKETNKPVIAFVDGLMASAAYWIGSAADEVYASGTTDRIGSIGTMISFRDYRAYYEKLGVKDHRIFADKSKDKNADFLEALEGNYKRIKENMLNPLNEEFLAAVKTNMPDVSEKALTGRVFLSNQAIDMGLINGIKSFEQAVQRALELANNQNQHDMFGSKFKGLSAIAEAEKQGIEITAEVITSANEELTEAGISAVQLVGANEVQSLQQSLADANTAKAAAEQAKAEAEQAKAQAEAALQAEKDAFAAFKAQPGADAGKPALEGNEKVTGSSADDYSKVLDELPHNKALDSNPFFN